MKGSGLGLAIARSLMALHGGALRIRSHVGIGTIAMLRIPVRPTTRAASSQGRPFSRFAGEGGPTKSGRMRARRNGRCEIHRLARELHRLR